MAASLTAFLECGMQKKAKDETPEIFLGEWLKLFGTGPTQAAKIARCTQSYISNISAGRKTSIDAVYLLRLSEHFKVTINDFFKRPPSQSQTAAFAELSPEAREAILARRAG